MCGLIGYSGAGNYSAQNLKILMILNAIDRGADATGFYNPEQGLVKAAEHAKIFLTKTPILNSDVFIGHVRAKTVGVNSDANAHPFSYKNVVLAHNGTLTNHYSLLEQYGLNMSDFNVDSQCVAGMLDVSMGSCDYNNFDPLDYFKPITQIEGFAAFLFKDKRDLINNRPSRLFAYRNDDRPLSYGFDENHNMYISSIEGPLEALGLIDITSFDSNTVYEIENGEIISETVLPRFQAVSTSSVNSAEKAFRELTKGLFSTDYIDLENTYVQFDIEEETAKNFGITKFTKGRFYFVEEVLYNREDVIYPSMFIKVKNDANMAVKVPIFAFNLLYSEFTYSNYVKTLTVITSNTTKGDKYRIAEVGDILKVSDEAAYDKSTKSKWVDVKVLDSKNTGGDKNRVYSINTAWIRPLTTTEVTKFLESQKAEKRTSIKKVITVPARKKIPAIVSSLFDLTTADLNTLASEEIVIDPTLETLTFDVADYIDQMSQIKESVDECTMFLLKILDKRKNQLDHNLYSFNDLKDHLMKIYTQINNSATLSTVSKTMKNEI